MLCILRFCPTYTPNNSLLIAVIVSVMNAKIIYHCYASLFRCLTAVSGQEVRPASGYRGSHDGEHFTLLAITVFW